MMELPDRFSSHLISAMSYDAGRDETSTELDSHADSPVVGKHVYILRSTGRKVSVKGFTDQLGAPILVPVVDAAVVYDCEYTGKSIVLVIRNALHLRNMDTNLIPPFMMRLAGLKIDECPKFLSDNPNEGNHSVYCPELVFRIPLHLDGIISFIPTRRPSKRELEELDSIDLTPNVPVWDPHDTVYSEQESSMLNYRGEIKVPENRNAPRRFIVASVITNTTDPIAFDRAIADLEPCDAETSHKISSISHVDNICEVYGNSNVSALDTSLLKESRTDAKKIARCWSIPLETAKKVIKSTTRLCKRNTNDITLNRRYSNNDRMLRYPRVRAITFMDTLLTSKRCVSFRGFTCAQIFATEFGYIFATPMKKRAELTSAVKLFFKQVGVPPKLIADKAKEQILGDTKRLCDLSECKIVELEKGTPAANRAERYIQMIKNEVKKDLTTSDSPLVFW